MGVAPIIGIGGITIAPGPRREIAIANRKDLRSGRRGRGRADIILNRVTNIRAVIDVVGDPVSIDVDNCAVKEDPVVIDIASEVGLNVKESMMNRYDLYTADEIFLTGTAAEVIAVVEMDKRKIGRGKPGKVTRDLEKRYRAIAESTGEPIK